MELFLGILFGVGLTLFGIWTTECLRNLRQRIKLINALYLEIIYNIMTSEINLKLCKENKYEKLKFFSFHTLAFENFKQGLLLDEDEHGDFLINLFQGYALIDMFNSKRIEFEKDFWPDDAEIFSEIKEHLKNVHDELQNKIKSVKI